MKRTAFLVFTLIGLIMVVESSAQRGKKDKLENTIDSVSYSIGISFATSLQKQNLSELNIEKITQAIEDVLNKQDAKLTEEESQLLIKDYITKVQENLKNENLIKANVFLEENKKKQGVIVLPSGLQYIVLKEGVGQNPLSANRVKTHYKGTLLDGTVFDSSYERGEPITFGVDQVIKGWQEALVLMNPGSKWRLFVPPGLGYGERNTGSIPSNSLLIFEIELIGIE